MDRATSDPRAEFPTQALCESHQHIWLAECHAKVDAIRACDGADEAQCKGDCMWESHRCRAKQQSVCASFSCVVATICRICLFPALTAMCAGCRPYRITSEVSGLTMRRKPAGLRRG